MDQEAVPPNAGAGVGDEDYRADQAIIYAESESLAPDCSQLDPASTAVAS